MNKSAKKPKQIVLKKAAPTLRIRKKEKANAVSDPALDKPCPHCGQPRLVEGAPQYTEFHCPYCGHLHRCRGEAAHSKVSCTSCGNTLLVPIPPTRSVKRNADPEAAPRRTKFFCVYCAQKLSATSDMAGQPTICPACARQLTIPVPIADGAAE